MEELKDRVENLHAQKVGNEKTDDAGRRLPDVVLFGPAEFSYAGGVWRPDYALMVLSLNL